MVRSLTLFLRILSSPSEQGRATLNNYLKFITSVQQCVVSSRKHFKLSLCRIRFESNTRINDSEHINLFFLLQNCSRLWSLSFLFWFTDWIPNIKDKKIKNFVVIFLARVLFMPKKCLHIVRNKIKNESWQLVEKKKSYSK